MAVIVIFFLIIFLANGVYQYFQILSYTANPELPVVPEQRPIVNNGHCSGVSRVVIVYKLDCLVAIQLMRDTFLDFQPPPPRYVTFNF